MGIDEDDFFSIRWVAKRESSYDFFCEVIVDAYQTSLFPKESQLMLALGGLKSSAIMQASNGSTPHDRSCFQQVVLQGLQPMQNFVLMILLGIRVDEDSALETVIRLTEQLEDYDSTLLVDPRMN